MGKQLYFLIVCFIIISCSKEKIDNTPSNFSINVENITLRSALITWDNSTSADNTTITYSVLLDNLEVASGITSNDFQLNDLSNSSNYDVTVVAENPSGVARSEISFSTLEPRDLKVSRMININNNERNIIFDYISLGIPTKIESSFGPGQDVESVLLLGNDDNIHHEYLSTNYGFRISCEYERNSQGQIIRAQQYKGYGDANWFSILEFNPPSVNYEQNKFRVTGAPGNTFLGSYNINLNRDNNQRLTEINITNQDTDEERDVQITYDDEGNIIKIITVAGDVWDIEYDDKNNFADFYGGFAFGSLVLNNGGLIYFPDENWQSEWPSFSEMYPLHNHRNKNNPISYAKNGEQYRNFDYEYNEYGFPSNIKIINSDGSIHEYDIEYLEL